MFDQLYKKHIFIEFNQVFDVQNHHTYHHVQKSDQQMLKGGLNQKKLPNTDKD